MVCLIHNTATARHDSLTSSTNGRRISHLACIRPRQTASLYYMTRVCERQCSVLTFDDLRSLAVASNPFKLWREAISCRSRAPPTASCHCRSTVPQTWQSRAQPGDSAAAACPPECRVVTRDEHRHGGASRNGAAYRPSVTAGAPLSVLCGRERPGCQLSAALLAPVAVQLGPLYLPT